jgi:hypothetical protein
VKTMCWNLDPIGVQITLYNILGLQIVDLEPLLTSILEVIHLIKVHSINLWVYGSLGN